MILPIGQSLDTPLVYPIDYEIGVGIQKVDGKTAEKIGRVSLITRLTRCGNKSVITNLRIVPETMPRESRKATSDVMRYSAVPYAQTRHLI